MKRIGLILILCFVIVVSATAGSAQTIRKVIIYKGYRAVIALYNGHECRDSRITVEIKNVTRKDSSSAFEVKAAWTNPDGSDRVRKMGWFPGGDDLEKFEANLCIEGNPVAGSGTLRIEFGWDEVFFTEYAFDGRYVRFGESYKAPASIDIDVKQKVDITVPESPTIPKEVPKDIPKETPIYSVFNINSSVSNADLYVDGNFVGNTPATVELPFGQHKIVVKKKGYKNWEKELNVSMKGKFSLSAELEKMSKEEIAAASRKIVFSSDVKEDGIYKHNIFIMNADGTDVKRLTHSEGNSNPSVSPDGKKIAFTSRRDKNKSETQIYIMDIDGSNVRRLTNSNLFECQPRWSPDGKKIAFVVLYLGNSEIYVVDTDGNNLRRLTDNTCWDDQPSWSPDSKKIAWTSGKGLVKEIGKTDGTFDIHVMNADGSKVKRLTNGPFDKSDPSWSSDGKKIAFIMTKNDKKTPLGGYAARDEVYVIDADGSNVKKLTNGLFGENNPSWSPDGKQIAFVSDRDGPSEIYVMDADGSNVQKLTNITLPKFRSICSKPRWSPNGKQIAFVSERDGNFEIYVMNADGGNVRRLTNNPGVDFYPSWCPLPQLIK